MVTGNTYRHPAVLANMATTVDIISNGRLDFGIGAGWNELEHESYGIPMYTTGERIRRMGEACEVARLLWTEDRANFDGKYYQLKDAMSNPKPVQKPYPPITIGGGGEQLTLRIVAEYADIWNFTGGPIETFKHKSAVLDSHCAELAAIPPRFAARSRRCRTLTTWPRRVRSFASSSPRARIASSSACATRTRRAACSASPMRSRGRLLAEQPTA